MARKLNNFIITSGSDTLTTRMYVDYASKVIYMPCFDGVIVRNAIQPSPEQEDASMKDFYGNQTSWTCINGDTNTTVYFWKCITGNIDPNPSIQKRLAIEGSGIVEPADQLWIEEAENLNHPPIYSGEIILIAPEVDYDPTTVALALGSIYNKPYTCFAKIDTSSSLYHAYQYNE